MFNPDLPAEPELRASVAADVVRLIRALRPSVVWTCAGIGGHVDHRLTRAVVEGATEAIGTPLVLWEDLPYTIGLEPPEIASPRRYVHVTDDHVARKVKAVGEYRSQLRMLWPDGENWPVQFLDHAHCRRDVCGVPEVLWSPTDSRPTPC